MGPVKHHQLVLVGTALVITGKNATGGTLVLLILLFNVLGPLMNATIQRLAVLAHVHAPVVAPIAMAATLTVMVILQLLLRTVPIMIVNVCLAIALMDLETAYNHHLIVVMA